MSKKRKAREGDDDWRPPPASRCECGDEMGRGAERCQHCERYGTPDERDAWFARWLAGEADPGDEPP